MELFLKTLKMHTMRINNSIKIVCLLMSLVMAISATLPLKYQQNEFKNLKILPKDISEAALDKIMDDFKMALGVDCNYCHAKNTLTTELDFASDKKPEKEIARKMMTMTMDINKKYFDFNKNINGIQSVTCVTCHRGRERPEIDSILLREEN